MKASVVGVCLVFGLLFVSCYDDSPSSGQVFVCDPTGDDCGDSGVCVQAGTIWVCSSASKCSPACHSPEVCVNGSCECFPSCSGLECGDDSCGGSCGKCLSGESWSCIAGKCKDDCAGLECGESPKLGVDCGTCDGATMWCVNNHCADDCANRECGESLHIGVNCGDCQDGFWCDGGMCKDDCTGRECGASPNVGVDCGFCSGSASMFCDDGQCADDCGGLECGQSPVLDVTCGICPEGDSWWCDEGTCEDDCEGLECGLSPSLGVNCGACDERYWCNAGTCDDDCGSAECGNGPHGISCGSCPVGESIWCDAGACKDDCAGRQCGDSSILGVPCGTCPDRSWCNGGTCEDDCGSAECGNGPHSISCGSCPVGESMWCDAGACKDDCAGRQCGDSFILGVPCGTCPDRFWCNAGTCEDDCGSAECGDGPHGISCGLCAVGESMWCDAGVCKDDCEGRQCGNSPFLDVSCGTCPDRSWCNAGFCEDDCGSAECGSGPHGIPCGSCPVGETIWCDAGVCKDDCDGIQCGQSPTLEVNCGTCGDRNWCNSGICEDDCGSAECGPGVHGISCGSCPAGEYCDTGSCHDQVCEPLSVSCNGNVSETCNELGSAIASSVDCSDFSQVCHDGDCCIPDCSGLECGDDGCGGSCGECLQGEACTDGFCEVTWQSLLFENFDDGTANGWSTPGGCAGYGCPKVVSGQFYFPGDWNTVRLPAVTNSGATLDAFEFSLVRAANFGRLCIRDAYSGVINDIVCIQHVADTGGAVVNNVKGSASSAFNSAVLGEPGTNHWRIERDLVQKKCTVKLDDISIGVVDCSNVLPTNYVLYVVAATVASCKSYIDDFGIEALF